MSMMNACRNSNMVKEKKKRGSTIASIMVAKLAICFKNSMLLVLTILTKFVSGSTKYASISTHGL